MRIAPTKSTGLTALGALALLLFVIVTRGWETVSENRLLIGQLNVGQEAARSSSPIDAVTNPRIVWMDGLMALDLDDDTTWATALERWRLAPAWSRSMLSAFIDIAAAGDRIDDAVRFAELSLQLQVDAGDVALQIARYLSEAQRWSRLIPFAESALEAYPESAEVETLLGNAFFQTGAMEPARSHLERGVALDPAGWESNNNYLRFLREQGPVDLYRSQLIRSNERFPETVVYWLWLGEVAMAEQRYEEAEAIFWSVLRERPEWTDVPLRLEELNELRDTAERTTDVYTFVLGAAPTVVAHHLHYVEFLTGQGENLLAQVYLCRLASQEPAIYDELLSALDGMECTDQ